MGSSVVNDSASDQENDVHSSRPPSNSSSGRSLTIPCVNDSWRLCMEHEWISLYMRLGMFTEEACAVQRSTKRSLLHELVIMMVRGDSKSEGELSVVVNTHGNDHDDEGHDCADVGSSSSNITIVVPSSIILRSLYFSCPQAMLLQDSVMGYTPLHCALAPSTTTSSASSIDIERQQQHKQQQQQQKKEPPKPTTSPSLDLVCTLLELSQGQNSYCEGTDNYCNIFGDEKDDVTSTTIDISSTSPSIDVVDNEEMVMLMQDHLGDTPLHTACRHGCNKRIFLALMEACPSALLIYNHDGMTPLRLLWYSLRESFQTTTSSSGADSSTIEDHSFYTEVEMVVHKNIHTYQDLTKFPLFKDAWEKTLMCLYILATTTTTPDEEDGIRQKKSAPRDVALIMSLLEEDGEAVLQEPPELPFQILHSIASTDCDGMAMELALKFYPDEPPDEEGRSVLDVAIARQAMMEQGSDADGLGPAAAGDTTHKTIADVLMRYSSNYGIQAATVKDLTSGSTAGHTHKTTTTNSTSITQQKRSLLRMMEQSTSSNSSYSSSLELKGVEPDEHGMLPMPSPEQITLMRSKKIKPSPRRRHKHPSTTDGNDQITSSPHDHGLSESLCQEEVEENNLFFDSG